MDWLVELFHIAALAPIVVLLVARGWQQRVPPTAYTLIAVSLGVSWAADWYLKASQHLHPETPNAWWVTLVYPVIQAAVIFWALNQARRTEQRRTVYLLLAATAIVSAISADAAGPEWWAQAAASVVVVDAVSDRRDLGLLRIGLLVYFGLGLAWWIWWPMLFGTNAFIVVYLGYQASRLIGLGLAAAAMWRPYRPRLL
jgi:hypothetical protein